MIGKGNFKHISLLLFYKHRPFEGQSKSTENKQMQTTVFSLSFKVQSEYKTIMQTNFKYVTVFPNSITNIDNLNSSMKMCK